MKPRTSFRLLAPIGRWVAGQLAHPHGWFGRVFMLRFLNRGNRELIQAALDRLDLSANTRLLDVGFGGGLSFELARRRGVVRLAGVDPSEAAVRRLRDHPPKWARGAELRIERGHVKQLPFGDSEFDAVISTNTIYFWPELEPAFAELRRVLRPSGRLVVGFSGAEKMRDFSQITRHGFQLHDDAAVVSAAAAAGFPRPELIALHGGLTEGDFLLSAVKET